MRTSWQAYLRHLKTKVDSGNVVICPIFGCFSQACNLVLEGHKSIPEDRRVCYIPSPETFQALEVTSLPPVLNRPAGLTEIKVRKLFSEHKFCLLDFAVLAKSANV